MWKFATIAVFLIAGCSGGGGSVSVGGGGHWESPEPSPPTLDVVGVVDSLGVDTETSSTYIPILDRYIDDGWFELYWFASAEEGYEATVRLSSDGYQRDSVVIGTYQCGPYELCDDSASLHCRFTENFGLGCDFTQPDAERYAVSVAAALDEIPAAAYLHVEICDYFSDYCDPEVVLPVDMY